MNHGVCSAELYCIHRSVTARQLRYCALCLCIVNAPVLCPPAAHCISSVQTPETSAAWVDASASASNTRSLVTSTPPIALDADSRAYHCLDPSTAPQLAAITPPDNPEGSRH